MAFSTITTTITSSADPTLSPPPVFSKRFQSFSRWVVVVVLWLMIGSIAIGKAGISNFMELVHERNVLVDTNMVLDIANQRLEDRIFQLQTSPRAQEHYLKQNFGYVEQGEFIYQYTSALPQ